MKNSAIQWTDHTFNAWEGCTKVAPECKNCYAETLVDHRFGRAKWGKGQPRRRTSANLWKGPLAWNAKAEYDFKCEACGEIIAITEPGLWNCGACGGKLEKHRPKVFCLSLGDWLDEEVPVEWLADLLKLIHDTPNLDWQLLTKRPENWQHRLEEASCLFGNEHYATLFMRDWCIDRKAPANIWIGVSAGADIEAALDIPAKIHFLSCEPMLHALDTSNDAFKHFDWIIFGGESGKNARPCDVDWIRQGVRFCRENSVAAFVKQLGRVIVTNGITGTLEHWPRETGLLDTGKGYFQKHLVDSHGGDWSEWPDDLRVREFPAP